MIYAVSDIHGCYDKYQKLLKNIQFGENDTLYVLGDVIDRGPDGFKILLDMAERPNVVGLMGNHEAMAVEALPGILRCLSERNMETMTKLEEKAMKLWFQNGGELSLADFLCLEEKQMQDVWDYMCSMPLYQEVEVGERKFLLLHGGLEHFKLNRPIEDYTPDEILWCRPKRKTRYYSDKCLVLGHTPTQLLQKGKMKSMSSAKVFRADTWIDIDCGCVFENGKLGCLCLDTMEEFYA